MKYNIEMNIAEALEQLEATFREKMGVPIYNEINVTLVPKAEGNVPCRFYEAVEVVRRYRHTSDQKIEAIKAVRAFANECGQQMGLADAKFFVESIR
jgi:ribosomal protein L7/L12